jgi:phospholipase/carboxylesterase
MQTNNYHSKFIPSQEKSDRLLIVLHGLGDSYLGYTWLPEELNDPKLNYLLLNAPDMFYEGFAWYDLYDDQAGGIIRSRKLLFNLFAELKENGWDLSKVALFGFSQGCVMCLDVGLRYPEVFAGICGVSGYLFADKNFASEISSKAKEQKWLFTYGSEDTVVPRAGTLQSIAMLQSLEIPLLAKEFNKGHTIEPNEELPFIKNWLSSLWL